MKSLIIFYSLALCVFALPTHIDYVTLDSFCASFVQVKASSTPEEIAQFKVDLQKFGIKPEDCKLLQMKKVGIALENEVEEPVMKSQDDSMLELDEPAMKDFDETMFRNEAKDSFKMGECSNCTEDTNDNIKEFTSTMDDTSDYDESLKLVGINVGIIFAVIAVFLIIAFAVKFACKTCSKRNAIAQTQNGKPFFRRTQRRY